LAHKTVLETTNYFGSPGELAGHEQRTRPTPPSCTHHLRATAGMADAEIAALLDGMLARLG
jgi:hypothetical protein